MTALTAAAFLASSCDNLALPESISIKTSAKYQAPLGTASFDLTKVLSPSAMRETIQNAMGGSAVLYEYIPGSENIDGLDPNALTYLLHYPAYNVPIDMSQYISQMDLAGQLGNIEKSFDISAGSEIDQSFTDSINAFTGMDSLNFTGNTATVPESSSDSTIEPENLPAIEVSGGNENFSYSRIYFKTGKISMTFKKKDSNPVGSGYTIKITPLLYDSSGNLCKEGVEKNINLNTGAETTLELPMTCEQGLSQKFYVKFRASVTASSGNAIHNHNFDISANSQDMAIKKITGASGSASKEINQTVSLSALGSGITSVSFSDAAIGIASPLPAGWTGMECTVSSLAVRNSADTSDVGTLTKVSSGGADYTVKDIYRWGATINPGTTSSVKVKGTAKITMTNATIDLSSTGTTASVPIGVSFKIKKVDSVTVNLSDLGVTPSFEDSSVSLPDELRNFVRKITFASNASNAEGNPTTATRAGFGFKCDITDTLPAGNTVQLDVSAFRKVSNSGQYYFNQTLDISGAQTAKTVSQNNFDIEFSNAAGDPDKLYLKMAVKNADSFTLKNIELGKSYTLGIKITDVIFDWDKITLDLSSVHPFKGETDMPLDIHKLLEPMHLDTEIEKMELTAFPVYFYAQKPSGLGNAFDSIGGFSGKIYLSYKPQGGTDKIFDMIAGEEKSEIPNDAAIPLVNSVPWPDSSVSQIIENKTDSNNVAYYMQDADPKRYSAKSNLNQVLMTKLDSSTPMKLNYSVNMSGGSSGVELSRAAVENSGSSSLSIDMAALLSFDFTLKAPLYINPIQLADEHWNDKEDGDYKDVLNRENASTMSQFADYVDCIKSVTVDYKARNDLLLTKNTDGTYSNLTVKADMWDLGDSGITKNMPLSPGSYSLPLTGTEIKNVFTTWPFHPDVVVKAGRDFAEGETSQYAADAKEHCLISRAALTSSDALSADVKVTVQMNGDKPLSVTGIATGLVH